MIDITVLRAAGLSDEQIIAVLETEQQMRVEARREQNRINKRNERLRQHVSADRADSADNADPPAPLVPPPPSPLETPSPTPLNPPAPQKTAPNRGSRLPSNWQPSRVDWDFAVAHGLAEPEIEREAGGFRDYWCAKPGKDGLKLDWSATWRNRIRGYVNRKSNGLGHGKPHAKTAADVARELVEATRRAESFDFDRVLPQIGRG